jgi:hypothetical protein
VTSAAQQAVRRGAYRVVVVVFSELQMHHQPVALCLRPLPRHYTVPCLRRHRQAPSCAVAAMAADCGGRSCSVTLGEGVGEGGHVVFDVGFVFGRGVTEGSFQQRHDCPRALLLPFYTRGSFVDRLGGAWTSVRPVKLREGGGGGPFPLQILIPSPETRANVFSGHKERSHPASGLDWRSSPILTSGGQYFRKFSKIYVS